jgi:hypothetical protein
VIRLHAICLCLDDAEFLGAAIASVYDHVDGITVGTTYDRDWQRRPVTPSGVVEEVLSRVDDPDRKVDLVVLSETNETRMRNRLMDLADPSARSRRVRRQHDGDADLPDVDYFLVLDADEVWEAADLGRLREHAERRRLPYYRVAGRAYFQRWRWRVDSFEWSVALVRSDRRLHAIRNPRVTLAQRVLARALRPIASSLADRVMRYEEVPAEVAVFHHASYVGPRERIERKLGGSTHRPELRADWLTSVYDAWDPQVTRDFHPMRPALYPSVTRVDDADLPRAVREHRWPPGYLS